MSRERRTRITHKIKWLIVWLLASLVNCVSVLAIASVINAEPHPTIGAFLAFGILLVLMFISCIFLLCTPSRSSDRDT
jgi:polyferredoxin